MKTTILSIFLFIWLSAMLYFGVGSFTELRLAQQKPTDKSKTPVIYDGLTFQNSENLRSFLDQKRSEALFPWIQLLPSIIYQILLSCCFSGLGRALRVLGTISTKGYKVAYDRMIPKLSLGFFVGLLILGVTYIIPFALTSSDPTIRPPALMFLALFAGFFSQKSLGWIETQIDRLFR